MTWPDGHQIPPAWPERINNSGVNYPRELLSICYCIDLSSMAIQKQAYASYNGLIECFLMTCVHFFVKRWHFRFDKQSFFHDKAFLLYGVVAQLVEHHNGIVGVWGSTPHGSTIQNLLICLTRIRHSFLTCGPMDNLLPMFGRIGKSYILHPLSQ